MSDLTIQLNGEPEKEASLWLIPERSRELFKGIPAFGIELAPASARGSSQPLERAIPADALVEVEVEGGLHFWTTAEDLPQRLAEPDSPVARGVAGNGAWTLPAGLELPGARRGFIGKLALKALRWLDIRPDDVLRESIVERVQARQIPTEGLFPVNADGSLGPRLSERIADGGPTLILLHGTASSTQGSFSRLWTDQGDQWKALRACFGERIYALEHWTLTRSPIENALMAARLLPHKGPLSLLSHSRGGLVGDLLCLDPRGFKLDAALAALDAQPSPTPAAAAAIAAHQEALRQLVSELDNRPELTLDRFVRVACPSRGTSLAGDKLDKFGSLLVLAAIGLEMKDSARRGFGTFAGPLLDGLRETVFAVLASRRRADELPGLEAMMPGAALVAVLNAAPARGQLFVIAGDAAPVEGDRAAALRIWLADRFYERDHDLVVDTRSMLDGALRQAGPDGPRCRVQFRSGGDVNHFSYFRNEDSAAAAVAALRHAPEAEQHFRNYFGEWPLGADSGEAARGWFSPREQPDPSGKDVRGTVILIPGLCGSQLLVNGSETWADLLALAGGAFTEKLAIDGPVSAGAPLADTYRPLANTLRKRGYQVSMHGYDWRKSLQEALPALLECIGKALDDTEKLRQPLHFVVHSMGGVLLRLAFATDKALWERWSRHPGDPRVLMLGTPNEGSHAITLLVTGRDTFFRQLAFLDLRHSQQDLLATAVKFPGVMELLPSPRHEPDMRLPATWAGFQGADRSGQWVLPPEEVLQASQQIWDALAAPEADALIASPRLIYVAGLAAQTPEQAGMDAEGHFQILATAEGDGRVPWASGIPASCRTDGRVYYVRAAHGDLPKAAEAYDGYLDLLEKGKSDKLSRQPPVSRGSLASRPWRPEASEAALFPSRGELLAAATGASLPSARAAAAGGAYRAEVRVLHGNLLYAESALMVGHTWGANALEFTEKLLDQALGGRLQRLLDAGLHAGALGTYTIYRKHPGDAAQGAIVLGIGRIGELTAGKLADAVSRAVAAHAIQELEACPPSAGGEAQSLGVSALLIGAGVGELSLQDSVAAIMRGHRDARRRLERAGFAARLRLDQLDFIEVLEDRAIQALHAARDSVDLDRTLAAAFFVDSALRPHTGRRQRASAALDEGHWQRIAISARDCPGERKAPLMFDVYGGLARAERSYNTVSPEDIDRFTASLIGSTFDQEQAGRALFELLVPNWLKDLAPDRRRTQLVLDQSAAAYPWELLRDRASEHDGDSGQPLSVRSGLVRQLSTGAFRLNVSRSNAFGALVVGDPLLGEWARFLHPLDGAKQEAESVMALLDEAGYHLSPPHVRDEGSRILLDLFSGEWRILHLSGHGVYEQDLPATDNVPAMPKLTGMVIGQGQLLTPAHIEQMRAVPDFVFVNCCNLGRIEAGPDGRDGSVRPGNPALAANLATQLIEIGVRCVIAAGWEVRDDAAELFATTFYRHFLDGCPFGEAVLAARVETFQKHASSNTWGAYQCYGNPGFVMPRPPRTQRPQRPLEVSYDFVCATEALHELEHLALWAGVSQDLDRNAADFPEARYRALLALCERQGWIVRGDILQAFGRLFGEHSRHLEAIACYQRALAACDGSASRKAEEQLASMYTRRAKVVAERAELAATQASVLDKEEKRDEAAAKLKEAEGDFKEAFGLLDQAVAILDVKNLHRPPNAERLNLRSAVEKRRLFCHLKAGDDRATLQTALKAMLRFSLEATDKTRDEGGDLRYPALNAANAFSIAQLAGFAQAEKTSELIHALLKQLRDGETTIRTTDFWGRAARADLLLAEGLFALTHQQDGTKELTAAAEAYAYLLQGQATPRERESVLSTLDTLLQLARALSPGAASPDGLAITIKTLADLLAALKR